MQKLSIAKAGRKYRVTSIVGEERFLSRITSIGITIGSVLKVIQNPKKRPILVYARDTMIAINNKECEKIMVEVMAK